jgi:hypothetical protein
MRILLSVFCGGCRGLELEAISYHPWIMINPSSSFNGMVQPLRYGVRSDLVNCIPNIVHNRTCGDDNKVNKDLNSHELTDKKRFKRQY